MSTVASGPRANMTSSGAGHANWPGLTAISATGKTAWPLRRVRDLDAGIAGVADRVAVKILLARIRCVRAVVDVVDPAVGVLIGGVGGVDLQNPGRRLGVPEQKLVFSVAVMVADAENLVLQAIGRPERKPCEPH